MNKESQGQLNPRGREYHLNRTLPTRLYGIWVVLHPHEFYGSSREELRQTISVSTTHRKFSSATVNISSSLRKLPLFPKYDTFMVKMQQTMDWCLLKIACPKYFPRSIILVSNRDIILVTGCDPVTIQVNRNGGSIN